MKRLHHNRYRYIDPYLPFEYQPITTVLMWIHSKYSYFVWIYGNVLVITTCRSLVETFNCFHDFLKYILYDTKNKMANETKGHLLGDCYIEMCQLIDSASKYIGPLVISCYGMNIYCIIIKVIFVCSIYLKSFNQF